MTITARDVRIYKRLVAERIRTNTPESARARLIAYGCLKEDGTAITPIDTEGSLYKTGQGLI